MTDTNSAPYVVGIDLGGTNARAVLARRDGSILGEVSHPSESAGPAEGTFDVLARVVAEVIAEQGVKREEVAGIGVGLPGIITPQNHCIWSPNFPHWRDVPIKEMLDSRTSLPSFFLNDARCATLGELHFGAGRGVGSMVFVGLGTGIGGGFVINGKLLLGRNGSVGEIAHHTVDPSGPQCGCGNFGCWEVFCGRDRIVRRAMAKLQLGTESTLLTATGGRDLSPRAIAEAANDGDALAKEVMDEVGYYVGVGVANLINMLNPERVVIGGGVAQAGELLFGPIRRTVRARAVPFQAMGCEIVPAQLGSDAGVQGAVVLVLDRLGEHVAPGAA
ncbi:MAG TPA: ROK family protein [Armatimonadota bacterium]|nr:ROK family protein [Armatimonadota bacterium]